MKRLPFTVLVGLVLKLTVGATPALGQHPQKRSGFWFNGELGWGSLGCDNCGTRTGGMSGGLSLGGTLNSHILLGVGTSAWSKSETGVTMTVATLDARIRVYPQAKGGFFLTGGVGYGSLSAGLSGYGVSASEGGVSGLLGVGYDIRVGPMVSVTPFWNGFAVKTSNSNSNVGQLGLGITIH